MSRFRGTIEQMVEAGVTVNGIELSQPMLSILTRIGNGIFAEAVGKIPPEGQGKPAIVWELASTDDLRFSVPRKSRAQEEAETAPKRRSRAAEVEEIEEQPKRRPGRPRKVEQEEEVTAAGRKPRVIDLARRLESRAA